MKYKILIGIGAHTDRNNFKRGAYVLEEVPFGRKALDDKIKPLQKSGNNDGFISFLKVTVKTTLKMKAIEQFLHTMFLFLLLVKVLIT